MSAIRLLRNGLRFWKAFGTRALVKELKRRLTTPMPPGMSAAAMPIEAAVARGVQSAQQLLQARFAQSAPLGVFVVPRVGSRRISVVTDSINKGSLFGGVGTAMILAVLLAEKHGARLRIISRTEPAQAANLHSVFALYGLTLKEEIEFAFAHVNATQASVNVFADELFITTSWWTTESTLSAIAAARILYVLQEDERMFYPAGDDQLRCIRTLMNDKVHVAVNTQGLLDHLVNSGLSHLRHCAIAFEPAFPGAVFKPGHKKTGGKRRFMFYARPNHLRNLFYFGLEVIDLAIARGVLDTAQWEIVFVGANAPAVSLCDGTVPVRHESMQWHQYAELAGSVDLALCLMFTPHPSYPPLDLAASGAVVVTNTFGNKLDLSHYCQNIIAAETQLESLLKALQQGIALAGNVAQRQRNYETRGLQQDWSKSFNPVLERFNGKHDWT